MSRPQQSSLFQSPARNTALRVGPAGWNYRDWEGIAYPSGHGTSFDPLAFLADYFDTVEINSSFYAPPRPEDAAAWAQRVSNNPRFRFTAKAWQRLTHEPREGAAGTLAADSALVRSALAPLAEAGKLGAVLIQFPWSFRWNEQNLGHLERIFHNLEGLPLVLEVRHGSWDSEQVYSWLREKRVGFCNVDQPVIGESLKPGSRVTSRVGYFRMHGRNYQNWFMDDVGRDARYDYLYTRAEIGELSRLIRSVTQDAEETYAITNNHFRGQALVNALEILEELDAQPPAVPPLLMKTYQERCPGKSDKKSG